MRFMESTKNRQQSMESIYRFIATICKANVQSLLIQSPVVVVSF